MAEQKAKVSEKKVSGEVKEKFYLIVNPKGCMHVVSEKHARARLRTAGWRLANAEEKQAYKDAGGNQRHNRPLAKPFSPEPELEEALPEAESVEA